MKFKLTLPIWTIVVPFLAWILFAAKGSDWGVFYSMLLGLGLVGAVLAAVHHAEVVAHRVGEPFGSLVLALAVTVIEASLIISLMSSGSGGHDTDTLARDTVFAALMIILTGIVGICLFLGSARYKEQTFSLEGVTSALAALITIAVITLILPNYTTSIPGPYYTKKQLCFVAVVTLIIYAAFVLVQTVRHRDYFLPKENGDDEEMHADPPSNSTSLTSLLFLIVSLVIVVLLAESLAPGLEHWIVHNGAPESLVGILISTVILLPEGISAIKAARKNRLQTSLNLALGSALASLSLTIPVVAFASLYTGLPLQLGIDAKSMILLLLSVFVVILSLRTGRTNILQGVILLILFSVYLFTTIFP
jgi:Ca2+:H+ antiporter